LILAILLIYNVYKSFNFSAILIAPFFYNQTFIFFGFGVIRFKVNLIISLLLFVGVVRKSAQLRLHTWLPAAMEGPTPVSALIHAATIVTAGVFLIIRLSFIFEVAKPILVLVTLIRSLTAIFAAISALVQNDLKKIIAYSTCSQLRYIVFICGLSNFSRGLFHLFNHAFFKALLFLTAGAIIHNFSDEQDVRKLSNLQLIIPLNYFLLIVRNVAILRLPFLARFYSKDFILEYSFIYLLISNNFVYYIGILTAALTTFYSSRLFFFIFITKVRSFLKAVLISIHFNSIKVNFVLFFLRLLSIFSRYIRSEIFIFSNVSFFYNSILNFSTQFSINFEFLPI
jgi:NADH:ubiquinone oxidoreductase subunit 5 (subunit L)/multisubunit Na+/H+ antiporter MnhA subunit